MEVQLINLRTSMWPQALSPFTFQLFSILPQVGQTIIFKGSNQSLLEIHTSQSDSHEIDNMSSFPEPVTLSPSNPNGGDSQTGTDKISDPMKFVMEEMLSEDNITKL